MAARAFCLGMLMATGLAGMLDAASAAQLTVTVDGISGELERNVRANLGIVAARRDDELDAARVHELHTKAHGEIVAALEPYGYYRAVVTDRLEATTAGWHATYEIDPGPALLVTQEAIEILGEGAGDRDFQAVRRAFPLAVGDRLVHAAYEAGKAALEDYAAAHGYLDAAFSVAAVRVDLASGQATIELRYDSGLRFRYGEVTCEQDFLDPAVVRGYVELERGAPLDLSELLRLQDALGNSPYFQRVEVITDREHAVGNEVPIRVLLTPSARQKWDLGLGYGTDTGPRASAALEVRRVNRRGHRSETAMTLSGIEQSLTSQYLIPGPYPRTDVWTLALGYARRELDDGRSETGLLGASRTASRGAWRETLGLQFQRENFRIGLDHGISELVLPAASWSRVTADDRIYPRHGSRLEGRIRATDRFLGSDASLVQVGVDAKVVRSLGAASRVIGRIGLGQTWTDDFRRLPPTLRYFAGGDQSVRGYGYRQLGRRDEAGNVIGGETLATASLELDSLFVDHWGRWGAAVFFDIGNAGKDLAGELEQGAGVGIRWLSPIGLVRGDIAWALTEPGTPMRLHITIGPDL